jgi:hypothetical protein
VATILFQLVGEVDDADGFEGAFFDAYAAAATEFLRYYDFVAFEAYGFYSAAYHGAEFYA